MITRHKLPFIGSLLVACVAGCIVWYACRPHEPTYQGKRLSVWADEVAALGQLRTIANGDHSQVRAMRAIGTNAIPWLVSELGKPSPLRWRLNRILGKQRVIKYRFPIPNIRGDYRDMHQLRARAGLWALGEIAEPAIPSVVRLIERQREFAPSALAGIGASALPALQHCLTNVPPHIASSDPRARIAESTIAALYVSLSAGRISRSEAVFLLPTIQAWARAANRSPAYWAEGVLREFAKGSTAPDN